MDAIFELKINHSAFMTSSVLLWTWREAYSAPSVSNAGFRGEEKNIRVWEKKW